MRVAPPYLFADERHQRMDQAQYGFEHVHQRTAGAAAAGGAAVLGVEHRLAEFEVPVAELVPGEIVNCLCNQVETIGLAVFACLPRYELQPREYPAIGEAEFHVAFE